MGKRLSKFLKVIRWASNTESKYVLYGQEGRLRLLRGCDQVSDAVKVTMGPKGRVVLIDQIFGNPQITKDGYTVAKAICLEDRAENVGCLIAKSVAERTNFEVGDGTSASMILTRAIFKEGCKAITGGVNADTLNKGIRLAVSEVVREIDRMSIKITAKDNLLTKVATVAANGDTNVGSLVTFVLKRVGAEAFVNVLKDKKLLESEVVFNKGYRIDQGAASPYFLTDPNNKLEFINPFVLIVDEPIKNIESIAIFLQHAANNKRELLILTKDIETKVLTYLTVNNAMDRVKTCVINYKAESITGVVESLEVLTKAVVINKKRGIPLYNADVSYMGSIKRVSIRKDHAVFISDNKKDDSFNYYIRKLKDNQQEAARRGDTDTYNLLGIELSKLLGESAVINVGAATELECSELKDRIDDSIHAAQAALKEGIVVGGGAALIHASKVLKQIKDNLSYEERLGVEIIEKACRLPCIVIADNAGYTGRV